MTLVRKSLSLVVLAALIPATAAAQSAEAEMLFRDGRKLIKAGKLEEGCEKIEASQKIEPSIGTLLNLGDCREKLGEHASAWAAFRKAEAMAKRAGEEKRRNEASKRAMALEPKLAYVAIMVPGRIEGLVVKRGEEVIDPALYNTPVPVDPDEYFIAAEAPGFKPWRVTVTVGGTKPRRQTITVPALEKLPTAAAQKPEKLAPTDLPPVVVTAAPPPRPVVVVEKREPSIWTGQRKLAVGVGIGGALALGAGVYFGLKSNDDEAASNEICPNTVCDDPEGLRLNDRAQTNARNANISYALGGVMIATGTVLWFLGAPKDVAVTPHTSGASGETGVSLTYGGKF